MKILKYLLGLILLLVLIFFGRGLLTPSISYSTEITVDKNAEEAWAVMSDDSILPEWIAGFKKMELVSGEKNTVGAVSNIYIEEGATKMVMQETIKEYDPLKRIAMEFTMDFMNIDYSMDYAEKDGKTTLKSSTVTKGNNLFARSMLSFMQGGMKKNEDLNMGNLKRIINENTKNYFQEAKVSE